MQVTAAVTKQLETLNTNSRYLHDKLVKLAKGITDKMPEPLQVMFMLYHLNCIPFLPVLAKRSGIKLITSMALV